MLGRLPVASPAPLTSRNGRPPSVNRRNGCGKGRHFAAFAPPGRLSAYGNLERSHRQSSSRFVPRSRRMRRRSLINALSSTVPFHQQDRRHRHGIRFKLIEIFAPGQGR